MNIEKKLNQYYTKPSVAKQCFSIFSSYVDFSKVDKILEPSAGCGSFFNLLPKHKRIGIDLDPKNSEIIKLDFFDFLPNPFNIYCAIGNPPFGKNSSLAVKFFNELAKYNIFIGLILPKTFRKKSLQNRLNQNFHLIFDKDLLKNSFIFNNKPYDVPCCFQIWQLKSDKRKLHKIITTHQDFEFVNNYDEALFIIQRVGGRAGLIKYDNFTKFSKSSHYLIKSNIEPALLINRFLKIDFSKVKYNTAGNPSIAASEIVHLYSKIINE